jgi:glycosyltransferase involved in cell wall biosynthesis
MPELRILHTNFHKYMVGESRRILAIVSGLQARGHYVALASPARAAITEQARQMGLPTFDKVNFQSGLSPKSDHRDLAYLRGLIAEQKINLVHTHGSKDTWVGAMAARLSADKTLLVRTRHNTYPVSRHMLNRLLYQRLIDKLVVNCSYVKARFEEDGLVAPEKISLIYSGVDLREYNVKGNGEKIREEFNLSTDQQLVGMVAYIIPRKGHRYFIEAAARVIAAWGDKVKFMMVGDGDDDLECELRQKVAALGLDNQIIFAGFRRDIPSILAALDIFVMPSTDEALARAITEALAMQKAVIATRVGGIPDIVRHRRTGLLVSPADAEELAQAVLTLLADRELAHTLGCNGRKLVEEEFSVEAMVDKTERLYYDLLANGR